jgi:hypothetical protein
VQESYLKCFKFSNFKWAFLRIKLKMPVVRSYFEKYVIAFSVKYFFRYLNWINFNSLQLMQIFESWREYGSYIAGFIKICIRIVPFLNLHFQLLINGTKYFTAVINLPCNYSWPVWMWKNESDLLRSLAEFNIIILIIIIIKTIPFCTEK